MLSKIAILWTVLGVTLEIEKKTEIFILLRVKLSLIPFNSIPFGFALRIDSKFKIIDRLSILKATLDSITNAIRCDEISRAEYLQDQFAVLKYILEEQDFDSNSIVPICRASSH